MFGLPEAPGWAWLFFVAPAIQILSHVDKLVGLSDWFVRALSRWREVTHKLWVDLFGWLHLSLPFDQYELDGLTLAVLCAIAALGSALRNSKGSLQSDLMASYNDSAPTRFAFYAVLAVVAFSFFFVFVGRNAVLAGEYWRNEIGADPQLLMFACGGTGALLFVGALALGRPIFERVRVEIVLGLTLFVLGMSLLFGWAMATDFAAMQAYIESRGIGWAGYALIVAIISAAISLLLAISWRTLPAILFAAFGIVVAERIANAIKPFADYLNSL